MAFVVQTMRRILVSKRRNGANASQAFFPSRTVAGYYLPHRFDEAAPDVVVSHSAPRGTALCVRCVETLEADVSAVGVPPENAFLEEPAGGFGQLVVD